jgi:acetyl esterase/lipase
MQRVSEKGAVRTIAYGLAKDQVGDLYLPDLPTPPVICLVHGGFWRAKYDRSYFTPVALDLMGRGFAVWSLEYRRVGGVGGGWPGTLDDVGAGIDYLATLAEEGVDIDLERIATLGHSAGGHLALWCARRDSPGGSAPKRVRIAAAVGLAPVADLVRAHEFGCGNGAVAEFLGGSPSERPERYSASSPMQMLPLGVPQLILHGTADENVPVDISRRYAAAAKAAGDDIRFVELATASHMDLVDPRGEAHAILCAWLDDRLLRA